MADPQTHSLACPDCHLADRVQKVSAIVKAGMWHGDLVGTSPGAEDDKNVSLQSENTTKLAQLLVAPEKPEQTLPPWFIRIARHVAIVAIALVAGLALVQLVVLWRFGVFEPPQMTLLTWQILSVGMIYYLLLLGNALLHRSKRTYDDALNKWKKAYYCHRCDGVFLPGKDKLTSLKDFEKWLYDR